MEKKLGQEPAFARPCGEYLTTSTRYYNNSQEGITKRFYAACAAMQGLLSSGRVSTDMRPTIIIKKSYELADELLKQENE